MLCGWELADHSIGLELVKFIRETDGDDYQRKLGLLGLLQNDDQIR